MIHSSTRALSHSIGAAILTVLTVLATSASCGSSVEVQPGQSTVGGGGGGGGGAPRASPCEEAGGTLVELPCNTDTPNCYPVDECPDGQATRTACSCPIGDTPNCWLASEERCISRIELCELTGGTWKYEGMGCNGFKDWCDGSGCEFTWAPGCDCPEGMCWNTEAKFACVERPRL